MLQRSVRVSLMNATNKRALLSYCSLSNASMAWLISGRSGKSKFGSSWARAEKQNGPAIVNKMARCAVPRRVFIYELNVKCPGESIDRITRIINLVVDFG